MKSKSGVLDIFKPTLNPAIWDGPNMKMDFKDAVFRAVDIFCIENSVDLKGVLMYGGNAGYQYGSSSDADISVYIDWDKAGVDKYDSLADLLRAKKFIYQDIEVHFMLKSPEERELVEANENVFNIVEQKWIQEPTKYDFDPKEEFAHFIDKANIFKRKLQERYDEVQNEIKELRAAGVESLPNDALHELKVLIGIVAQIRKNRDLEHQKIRQKAIKGEKITIFDRATENEIVWKTIADLPMTSVLKELSYKQ